MMKSNAYIGQGIQNNIHVMKVGKSNDIKRRQRELQITFDGCVVCLNSNSAYKVERQLREFVIQQGGIRYQETLDWFLFDPEIYESLQQNLLRQVTNSIEKEDEILQFIRRYYEIVIAEIATQNVNLQREQDATRLEIDSLKKQIEEERKRAREDVEHERGRSREEMERLLREIAELRYEIGKLESSPGKPKKSDKGDEE